MWSEGAQLRPAAAKAAPLHDPGAPRGSAPNVMDAPCAAWKLFGSGFGVAGGALLNDAATAVEFVHRGIEGVVCHSGSQQNNT